MVQWLRDDKELKKGKRVLFEEEQLPEGVKYKMTIRDIVMKDFGKVGAFNILVQEIKAFRSGPKS